MTQFIIFTTAITTGIIYTMIYPISLPNSMLAPIATSVSALWSLDGLLPITAIMACIKWDLIIMGSILIFKLVFGALAGKPEID